MSTCFGTSIGSEWRQEFASHVATPEQALARLRPGQRVFIGTGCAQPVELVRAMSRRSRELEDIEVVHLLTAGEAPYASRGLSEQFHVNSFFIFDGQADDVLYV